MQICCELWKCKISEQWASCSFCQAESPVSVSFVSGDRLTYILTYWTMLYIPGRVAIRVALLCQSFRPSIAFNTSSNIQIIIDQGYKPLNHHWMVQIWHYAVKDIFQMCFVWPPKLVHDMPFWTTSEFYKWEGLLTPSHKQPPER